MYASLWYTYMYKYICMPRYIVAGTSFCYWCTPLCDCRAVGSSVIKTPSVDGPSFPPCGCVHIYVHTHTYIPTIDVCFSVVCEVEICMWGYGCVFACVRVRKKAIQREKHTIERGQDLRLLRVHAQTRTSHTHTPDILAFSVCTHKHTHHIHAHAQHLGLLHEHTQTHTPHTHTRPTPDPSPCHPSLFGSSRRVCFVFFERRHVISLAPPHASALLRVAPLCASIVPHVPPPVVFQLGVVGLVEVVWKLTHSIRIQFVSFTGLFCKRDL